MSRAIGLISLLLLAVLFLGINVAADRSLEGARLDLTEGGLYTLTDASRRIARSPEEPVRLRFYHSRELMRGIPGLEGFGRRVLELLRGFESASNGRIELEVINPEPFSEAEDEAVAEGLTPQPISATDNIYFGLVATNALGEREVIPLFRPNQERFLEYRIAQLIAKLAEPEKPTLGLITGLPMTGGFDPRTQRPRGEWAVLRELRATFEVELIEPDAGEIPESVDVLMVVHPKTVTPETVYAIDQFILAGGRAAIFVDPLCESDQAQSGQMMQVGRDRSSDLPELFGAWGVSMREGQIAGDLNLAIPVQVPGPRPEVVPYLIWLGVPGEQMSDTDPVTGQLSQVNLASSGFFDRSDDAPAEWEPLITTTEQAAPVAREAVEMMPNPKGLLNDFFPAGEPLVLAARITGVVPTAFPQGRPEPEAEEEAGEADGQAEPEAAMPAREQLMEAGEPINVIVVADCDMLEDGAWVRELRLGGQLLGFDVLADNGAFAVNAAEQLSGTTDLLALRARGAFERPFTLLEEMQRQAEAEFLAKEQTLQEEIEQTRQRINELQTARTDAGTASALVLTPEQQAEVERLQDVLVEKRKELREVQLNLRKDIEALETRLKLINIGLVPLALCVFAVALGGYRAARRRIDRRRGSER